MPKYSIVEIVLETNIDFENQESMTHHIVERSISLASQIQEYSNHCFIHEWCGFKNIFI